MTDINIGAITEALNDKEDRDLKNTDTGSGADAVIEFQNPTAENDYTWYKKYASGRVEQGGYYTNVQTSAQASINISLVKEMANTNYHLITTIDKGTLNNDSSQKYCCNAKRDDFTTTTFAVSIDSTSYIKGMYWEVKGMAQG